MNTYPPLCLTVGHKYQFLHPSEVLYITSEGAYSHIFLHGNKKITISKKLKHIEAILPDDLFVRVHHSSIVNLMHIDRYHNDTDQTIQMINGERVALSRRKKSQFLSRFVRI